MDKINELNDKLVELTIKPKKKQVCKNTKEYALAYYHKNNVPCVCVCGKSTTTFSIYKHRFSKAHLKIMEIQDIEQQIQTIKDTIPDITI
jgi:hypothetical protein